MDNSRLITKYKEQISSRENTITSLTRDNVTLQSNYDAATSRIKELEQELETVLSYRNAMDKELAALEELTDGAGSPMGRIKFLESGILESQVLAKMETRIAERRQRQAATLDSIATVIKRLDQKASEIEEEIERERAKAANYSQMLSSNKGRINNLRSEITSRRSSLRGLV
jgi:chromosome segregation ATPase